MRRGVNDRTVMAVIAVWAVVAVAIPYGLAALVKGTAEAKVLACARGVTPFAVMATLMFAGVALAVVLRSRLPWPLAPVLSTHGVRLLAAQALVYLPFWLAWLTHSSACTRGRAFFWQSVLVETFILAILAASYNLMFGFAGVISFGHAAFFGLGAYGVGLLMKHLGWGLFPAVGVTLVASALLGALVSGISLRTRGLYFALFTLALAEILHILVANRILVDITGAEDGFTFTVPTWLDPVRHRLLFYYLALVSLLLTYVLIYRLIFSPTGRVLLALRENEARAQMLGYNTFAYKTFAIVLAGVLASYAGILRGLLNKGASPNVLGLSFTMDPLLMSIIGGLGTFDGPVLGAFLLRLIQDMLRDTVVHLGPWDINVGERWALILGIIFVVSVLAFPQGIVGTWRARRRRARFSESPQ